MGVDDLEEPEPARNRTTAERKATLEPGFVALQQVIEQRRAVVTRELDALVTHPRLGG